MITESETLCFTCYCPCSFGKKENTDETRIVMFEWQTKQFCSFECLNAAQKFIIECCVVCSAVVGDEVKGKLCLRFGLHINQFCSEKCIKEYKTYRFCLLCKCKLSVNSLNSVVKFCSLFCCKRYAGIDIGQIHHSEHNICTNCQLSGVLQYEKFSLGESSDVNLFYCSLKCLFAQNKNETLYPCNQCGRYLSFNNCYSCIYQDSGIKMYCSSQCLSINIFTEAKIKKCTECKIKKYSYDLIKSWLEPNDVYYCSVSCLSKNVYRWYVAYQNGEKLLRRDFVEMQFSASEIEERLFGINIENVSDAIKEVGFDTSPSLRNDEIVEEGLVGTTPLINDEIVEEGLVGTTPLINDEIVEEILLGTTPLINDEIVEEELVGTTLSLINDEIVEEELVGTTPSHINDEIMEEGLLGTAPLINDEIMEEALLGTTPLINDEIVEEGLLGITPLINDEIVEEGLLGTTPSLINDEIVEEGLLGTTLSLINDEIMEEGLLGTTPSLINDEIMEEGLLGPIPQINDEIAEEGLLGTTPLINDEIVEEGLLGTIPLINDEIVEEGLLGTTTPLINDEIVEVGLLGTTPVADSCPQTNNKSETVMPSEADSIANISKVTPVKNITGDRIHTLQFSTADLEFFIKYAYCDNCYHERYVKNYITYSFTDGGIYECKYFCSDSCSAAYLEKFSPVWQCDVSCMPLSPNFIIEKIKKKILDIDSSNFVNKSTTTWSDTCMKGVQCSLDEDESDSLKNTAKSDIVAAPFPIYIPSPFPGFPAFAPVPLPIPVPVAVPICIPLLRKSMKSKKVGSVPKVNSWDIRKSLGLNEFASFLEKRSALSSKKSECQSPVSYTSPGDASKMDS